MKNTSKKSGPGVSTGAYKTGESRQDLVPNLSTHLQPTLCAAGMGAVRTFILTHLRRFSTPIYCMAANEAETAEIIAGNDQAFNVGGDGVMIIPFQEAPVTAVKNGRPLRILQRIDAEAGNAMAADLGNMVGKLKRLFVNPPIFNGHPFHPDPKVAAKYADRRLRGSITRVEVANESVRLIPEYNKLGRKEVDDKQLIFHSPQWKFAPVMAANGQQEIKDGLPVYRPVSLHSGALTNEPNLEVPPVSGANDTAPSLDINKLIAPFIAEGFITADDDEAAILSAINALVQDLKWGRQRKLEMAAQLAAMKKALPNAANDADHAALLQELCSQVEATAANEAQHEADITAANDRFKAARTARVNAAMDQLITQGRVTNANADALRTELIDAANEADVDARITELGKTKPRLGITGGVTDQLKDKGKIIMAANERTMRNRLRDEAVNDCLAEITGGGPARPGDDIKAWNLARARNPELFSK